MDEKTLKKFYFKQFIIWVNMVLSVVIYLVLGIFVLPDVLSFENAPDVEKIRYLLAAVSISVLTMNIFIMKRVLATDRYDGAEGTAALTPYALNSIIPAALNESVAIFGLTLYMLAGDEFDLYAFCALSLVYHFMFMPKYSVLKNWAIHKELLVGDRAKDPNVRGYRK